MGKSANNKKNSTTMDTDYLFTSFGYDSFATVSQGIDRHRLRVYATSTGNLTHDYQVKNDINITSLSWGTVLVSDQEAPKLKKSEKKLKSNEAQLKAVILGTETGAVLIYSVEQDRVIKTIQATKSASVLDSITNSQGSTLYTLSQTGSITEWAVEDEQPTSEWKTTMENASRLAINSNNSLLAVGGTGKIELWDIKETKLVKTLVCEENEPIQHLIFSQQRGDLLISDGKNSVYIWDTQNKQTKPVKTFTVKDGIRHVDAITKDNVSTILAVSNKGTVDLWKHGNTGSASSSITVVAGKQVQIPILWASFTKRLSVVIVRGSSAKPLLETVTMMDEKNALMKDIILTRLAPSVISNGGDTFGDDIDSNQQGEDKEMTDDTQRHTHEQLIKALQSEDKQAILTWLEQGSTVEEVEETLHRLSESYIPYFVTLMVDELESQPLQKRRYLVPWLRRTVAFHYGLLMEDLTVSKRLAKMSRVLKHQGTDTLPKVYALRGRLEMIQQQLEMRSKRAVLDEEDASQNLEFMQQGEADEEDEDEDEDDLLTDEEDENDGNMVNSHKDEDMFLEEMAEDDVDEDVDSELDDSDVSM